MPPLIWSPQALQDVQRLYRFLPNKNAAAAKRTVKAICESVKVLAHQPGIGRRGEDIKPEYRE
ncbi:type II toxin-antitoxin system RelE/ParE family toxin [Nitrosospira multiformis]|uniref:type II toxin-antitoxin system RelE/ParE family toxin n=1 Tax=Nitrosospira multiformis TaxID=1231 RepID=UPI001C43347E|nr:type II toxin-antitoxin system RelE/ParE family toxin [Nitrosospira multiformis]